MLQIHTLRTTVVGQLILDGTMLTVNPGGAKTQIGFSLGINRG